MSEVKATLADREAQAGWQAMCPHTTLLAAAVTTALSHALHWAVGRALDFTTFFQTLHVPLAGGLVAPLQPLPTLCSTSTRHMSERSVPDSSSSYGTGTKSG